MNRGNAYGTRTRTTQLEGLVYYVIRKRHGDCVESRTLVRRVATFPPTVSRSHWHGCKDSNPDRVGWSHQCSRYTTPAHLEEGQRLEL
jgi:hypothetical protein